MALAKRPLDDATTDLPPAQPCGGASALVDLGERLSAAEAENVEAPEADLDRLLASFAAKRPTSIVAQAELPGAVQPTGPTPPLPCTKAELPGAAALDEPPSAAQPAALTPTVAATSVAAPVTPPRRGVYPLPLPAQICKASRPSGASVFAALLADLQGKSPETQDVFIMCVRRCVCA